MGERWVVIEVQVFVYRQYKAKKEGKVSAERAAEGWLGWLARWMAEWTGPCSYLHD